MNGEAFISVSFSAPSWLLLTAGIEFQLVGMDSDDIDGRRGCSHFDKVGGLDNEALLAALEKKGKITLSLGGVKRQNLWA